MPQETARQEDFRAPAPGSNQPEIDLAAKILNEIQPDRMKGANSQEKASRADDQGSIGNKQPALNNSAERNSLNDKKLVAKPLTEEQKEAMQERAAEMMTRRLAEQAAKDEIRERAEKVCRDLGFPNCDLEYSDEKPIRRQIPGFDGPGFDKPLPKPSLPTPKHPDFHPRGGGGIIIW